MLRGALRALVTLLQISNIQRWLLQWYRENRELKRRSSVLMQKVIQVAPESISCFTDDTDSGVSTDNDDFEDLRKTVQGRFCQL